MRTLQGYSGHPGEQRNAESRFRIEKANGALRVFRHSVKKCEAVVEVCIRPAARIVTRHVVECISWAQKWRCPKARLAIGLVAKLPFLTDETNRSAVVCLWLAAAAEFCARTRPGESTGTTNRRTALRACSPACPTTKDL